MARCASALRNPGVYQVGRKEFRRAVPPPGLSEYGRPSFPPESRPDLFRHPPGSSLLRRVLSFWEGRPKSRDHDQPTHPRHRRRPCRVRGGVAGGSGRRAGRAARDAPGPRHRRAQDGWPGRARLLQFLPLRRRRHQCGGPSACRDAAGRLADHAMRRRAPGAGRRRAGRRPRRLLRRGDGAPRGASAHHHPSRGGSRPAAARMGPGHRRHRAADGARAGRGNRRRDRRRSARLLRRHRADRPFRHHRHGRLLVPVALRQGRARRHRQGLRQLPARPRAVRGLRRGAARRRQGRHQGLGRHPLFRRLPADRDHGRAWPPRRCATAR